MFITGNDVKQNYSILHIIVRTLETGCGFIDFVNGNGYTVYDNGLPEENVLAGEKRLR